jgi:ABC-type phosphate transport system substrate-binding protein
VAYGAVSPDSFPTRRPSRDVPALLALLGCLMLLHAASAFSAEGSAAGKTAWEKTVEAAKKEGQISVYGSDTFELFLKSAFQKKYPEIKISYVGGRAPVVGPKLITERVRESI